MTKLILMRHGATEANLRHPYTLQGSQPDSELAAAGVAQSRAAAEVLCLHAVIRIYASPLKRARGTASEVADQLGLSYEVEGGLLEVDVGLWAGLSWPEIERRWTEAYRAFREQPERHGYLGGENLTQVRDRVLPVVQTLLARHPG